MAAEKEIKIPTFSVMKKGSILKHIFLNSPEPGIGGDGDDPNREAEPILMGRHPDCHIVLDHPSISRFHLEVRIKPAMQKLSLVDRSSVHGTWISGTKIQPHVPVDLVDGDLLRLGSSTRTYRFQWVPVSRALEMEKPMEALLEEREETYQEEIPMPLHTNSDDTLTSKNPSVSESKNPSSLDEFYSLPLQMEGQSPAAKKFDEQENLSFSFVAPVVESVSFSSPGDGENGNLDDFSAVEAPSERENPSPLASEKQAMSSGLLSGRSKSISLLPIPLGRTKATTENTSFDKDTEEEIQKEDIKEQGQREGSPSKVLFADNNEKEEEEAISSEKENSSPKISADQECKKSHTELQNSTSNVVMRLNTQEVFNSPSNEKQDVEIQKEDIKKQGEREGSLSKVCSLSKVLSADNNEKDVKEAISSEEENSSPKISADQECRKNHTELQNSPSNVVICLNTQEEVFNSPSNDKQDVEIQKEDIKKQGEREGSLSKVLFADNNEKEGEEVISSEKENSSPKISTAQECKKSHTELQISPSDGIHLNTQEVFNSPSNDKQDVEIRKEDIKKQGEREGSLSKVLFADNNEKEGEEVISSEKENSSPKISAAQECKKSHTELQNSPSDGIHLNIQEEVFNLPSNEKQDAEIQKEDIKKQGEREGSLSKVLFADNNEKEEEEAISSEKENSSPKISADQECKKSHTELQNSPSDGIHLNTQEEVLSSPSNEKQDVQIQKENIKKQGEREGSLSKVLFADKNEKEEAVFLEEEDSSPKISADQECKKSHTELQNSPSGVIIHLNTREVFNSDEENWMPQVSEESELKRLIPVSSVKNKEQDTYASDEEHVTLGISLDHNKMHPSLDRSPSTAISSFNLKEDIFHSDREMWMPESSRVQSRKKLIFENHMENATEDASALDKDNVSPQLSFEQVLGKSQRDLRGSSIDISSLNMEGNQFQYDRENWAPEVLGDLNLERPISKNNASNRRDKGTFASNKENSTTKFCSGQKSKSNQDEQQPFITSLNAEDVFPSDKENQTPEVPRAQKLKKPIFGNRETNTGRQELFPSDKENWTPDVSRSQKSKKPISESLAKIERELTGKRLERFPLQLLFDNNCDIDGQRMVDKCNIATSNSISANRLSVNNTEKVEDKSNGTLKQPVDQILCKVEEKKKWNIVVDTSCFLDEESKRSLQLLVGLKRTHLIIPMMVIRELDCMKRRKSWFQKETKASAALQWIEECMVKSSSWIHVQSSSEMILASKLPASPQSGNNEVGAIRSGLMAFSTGGSLMEILSPTAEDHILDTALLFKRIKTDRQLVLLSNNTTLKIKAMAEGLPCRTPKEFHDSLVNPYSKRFLWMESSARGSTWSSSDQMAYTENYYYQLPDIKKVVDGAKGLRLILPHNSHYA